MVTEMAPEVKKPNDPFFKLAVSVNPFFRYYSSPRLIGVSVALAMLIAVIGITLANYQCIDVVDTSTKFAGTDGFFTLQKVFIDGFMQRPSNLADDVKREAKMCTLYVTDRYINTVSNVQTTTNSYTETNANMCILPPAEFLDAMEFPGAFYFCDNLDDVPDDLELLVVGNAGIPTQEAGKQYTPKEFFELYYDSIYPGWRCGPNGVFADKIPSFMSDCNDVDSTKIYNYCGFSVAEGESGVNLVWNSYNEYPSGTQSFYIHGYIVSETLTTTVCSSLVASIGAAIGYIGYVEMLATVLFVSLFVGIGCAKPLNKNATISNMMKGAGMSALAEEIEKQRQEREAKEEVTEETELKPTEIRQIQPL